MKTAFSHQLSAFSSTSRKEELETGQHLIVRGEHLPNLRNWVPHPCAASSRMGGRARTSTHRARNSKPQTQYIVDPPTRCYPLLMAAPELTAERIKSLLGLEPHPVEGGFYRRTYSCESTLDLPRGVRPAATAIYYLLEPGTFSEMHVLDSDEIFHFYYGDPVEMLQLHEVGHSVILTLGQDLQAGQHVQLVVPAGVWQGTRLIEGGKVALLGCTVTPGFDFADYRSGSFSELSEKWPKESDRIRKLTRE